MTIADAPMRMRASPTTSRSAGTQIPCDSFHFGSGYTSIGRRRYAFNWNRDKFPAPRCDHGAAQGAGMQPVTNLKPCLLDDHPRLRRRRTKGSSSRMA